MNLFNLEQIKDIEIFYPVHRNQCYFSFIFDLLREEEELCVAYVGGRVDNSRYKTPRGDYASMVQLTAQPVFFTVEAVVEADSSRIWVIFDPKPTDASAGNIYYDGIVLVKGERTGEVPPIFNADDDSTGVWGEMPFTNLLRNGSVEIPGLRISPRIDQIGARFLPDHVRPSLVLTSFIVRRGQVGTIAWHLNESCYPFCVFLAGHISP